MACFCVWVRVVDSIVELSDRLARFVVLVGVGVCWGRRLNGAGALFAML